MKTNAYAQYDEETNSWLHRGRASLVSKVLELFDFDHDISILEAGAGVGQNVAMLSNFGSVDAIEIDPLGLQRLRKCPQIRNVFDCEIPFDLDRTYDVICALDVIEHLKEDGHSLSWLVEHLNPQGILVVTVPAFPILFSGHDISLQHYRRYTKSSLLELTPKKCDSLLISYFNCGLMPLAVLLRIPSILKYRLGFDLSRSGKQSSRVPNKLDEIFYSILESEGELICEGEAPLVGMSLLWVIRRTE